jgi:predicted PurR-regulated permease PerM
MELVYFTLTGIVLYILTDRVLDRIERARGARFENRSIIFFAIILVLALISFQIIQNLMRSGG